MQKSIIQEKSYEFAKSIIVLYSTMKSDHNEYIISKQLLRSGTSIGANVMEALHAESKKDFIHKMSIAYKEANETQYWLQLLHDTNIC
jgi:four helix bundle protein